MSCHFSHYSDLHNETGKKLAGMSRNDSDQDGSIGSRIQNATQNVMGKIGGISKITGNIGGFANKIGGGFMKF